MLILLRKILSKLGYIHSSELTEEFLLTKLAWFVDVERDEISEKLEKQIFSDMAQIENINYYLNSTMAKDMKREFTSGPEQRATIHGAFARTAYFKSKLLKTKEKPKVDTKLKGLRYE